MASGEICYSLNGDNQGENVVWFQTLGEDAHPVLDKTHLVVLYDNVLGYHNEDEDPDGIENADFNDNVNLNINIGGIYNLSGQRLSKVQKGLNIINGKKVVIK